jgi:hypothetical protein
MALGDLAQAPALAAIALDSGMVQFKGIAVDVPPFKAGATHAGARPLDDQAYAFGQLHG